MRNKFLFLTLLGALGSTSYSIHAANDFSGFFGGVSGGVAETFGKMTSTTNITYIDPSILAAGGPVVFQNHQLYSKVNARKINPQVGLTLGYGNLWDNYYLGGELGGSYVRGKLKDTVQENFNSISPAVPAVANATVSHAPKAKIRNWEVALDLTPGIVFENFLFYGRVGIGISRIQLNSTATFTYQDNIGTPFQSVSVPLSATKNVAALRLGIGAGHYISENLVLNVNYIYSYYGKISASGVTNSPSLDTAVGTFPIPNGFTTTTTARLNRQSVMIGLNYFFGN